MHCVAEEGKSKIKYLDIQSLYPFVNYSFNYPVGHPTIITHNKIVNWSRPEDNTFQGIIKCIVVPPRRSSLPPILPVRLGDPRLLFPYCRKCSTQNKIGIYAPNYSCKHNDAQRSFVVTTTHLELNEALRHGYQVIKLLRTFEFDQYRDDIFKEYVRQFLQIKIQASGWPESCSSIARESASEMNESNEVRQETREGGDNIPNEILEARQYFIKECHDNYGITLDSTKMCKNPGLRYISKLCLNSLWGRFSLRNTLSKTEIVTSADKLADYWNDYRIEISELDQLTETAMMVTYKTKDEFITEHPSSNIVCLNIVKFVNLY